LNEIECRFLILGADGNPRGNASAAAFLYEIAGRLSPPNAYVQWDAAHKWALDWLNHHLTPATWRDDIFSMVAGNRSAFVRLPALLDVSGPALTTIWICLLLASGALISVPPLPATTPEECEYLAFHEDCEIRQAYILHIVPQHAVSEPSTGTR